MSTVISVQKRGAELHRTESCVKGLVRYLPQRLLCELESAEAALGVGEHIEELRLRCGRHTYLTVGGFYGKKNIMLDSVVGREELARILEKICDGSLYAYSESIIKGYICLRGGIRVGICGRAAVEGGKILGIYGTSALNIRLPCKGVTLPDRFLKKVKASLLSGEGVLIYSPPAQGKTTMLRSLARELSGGVQAMRVAVVDTGEELGGFEEERELSLDILSGYPKAEGIRIATAFMNPQVIICDEIGSEEEAFSIAKAQNCGVPLVASAHGNDARGILLRDGMKYLHRVGAFGIYARISIDGKGGFDCKIERREDISLEAVGDNTALPLRSDDGRGAGRT